MAALRRSVLLPRRITTFLVRQRCISSSAVLQKGWNKDWMPEKYPQNEEERQESALKHGFLPGDYKPMPDDGDAHGDYPDMALVGEEQKSPWENWDDPYMQRNFGEPLQLYHESIMRDKGDPARQYTVKPRYMLAVTLTVILTYVCLMLFPLPYRLTNSRYEMWYPYDDMGTFKTGDPIPSGKRQIHYSFEPAE